MKRKEKIYSFLLLFFMFLVIVFSFRSNPFSKVLNEHDSSMFLYFGRGISEGLIPYKDMLDHKGPVLFIIQYFAVLIGNGNLSLGIWLIECIFLLVTLLYLYKSCLFFTKNELISAIAIVMMTPLFILCYDGGNYSEEFAISFISFSFFLFNKLVFEKELSKIQCIIIGFLGAATFFIRMNMISLWVIFCLFLVFYHFKDHKVSALVQLTKYIFLGGIFLTVLVISISLLQNNLKEMFQQAFLLNILYSGSNFSGKIQSSFSFIDLLLKTGIFPIIMIYFISIFDKKSKISNRVHLVLFFYFVLNFLTVIMSGRYYTHYLITQFVPISVMLAFAIQFIVSSISDKKSRLISMIMLLLIVLPSASLAFKRYDYRFNTTIFPGDQELRAFSKFINQNTSKKDKIYVHTIDANVYLLSDRYSNSRFFTLPAIDYNNFPALREEFINDFTLQSPKYVVVRKRFFEDEKNTANLNDVVANKLEKKYHEIKPIKAENYSLYELDKSN
ncbi:hypothetical protein ACTXNW_15120 [Enterococcus malodoratus]|uniref:hypothetical protein n=1 Tax=Enterococcus malodoratus TaxID=71451 RepID=UPI003FCFDD8E